MIGEWLRHRHSGLNNDGEKIRHSDLIIVPKKYCDATKSTTQNPGQTGSVINIDTYKTNDPWMSVTGWRITITKTARYLVICNLGTGNAFQTITWVAIHRNGSEEAYSYLDIPNWSNRALASVSKVISCQQGDYLEMFWYSWANIENAVGKTNMQVQELEF